MVLQRVVDLLDRSELHVRALAARLAARGLCDDGGADQFLVVDGCLLPRVDDAALGADDERLGLVIDDVGEQNLYQPANLLGRSGSKSLSVRDLRCHSTKRRIKEIPLNRQSGS